METAHQHGAAVRLERSVRGCNLKPKKWQSSTRSSKATVEASNGWIKSAFEFGQFPLRGIESARANWKLMCLAMNPRRIADWAWANARRKSPYWGHSPCAKTRHAERFGAAPCIALNRARSAQCPCINRLRRGHPVAALAPSSFPNDCQCAYQGPTHGSPGACASRAARSSEPGTSHGALVAKRRTAAGRGSAIEVLRQAREERGRSL
ncbi:MAG: transposase [Xanthomonadales bacterium]|nr:transposase [Xanthomonadales bacterium]